MTKYIVFSESTIGVHSKTDIKESEFHVFALVFPTVVALEGGSLVIKTDLKNNKVFKKALSMYEDGGDCKFLIGYDLDENGEVMASVLKDNLIFRGVSEYDILRTPLAEKGYLAVRQFGDISSYKVFLYYQQEIEKKLLSKKLPRMGIFKILAIQYLRQKTGRTFNLERTAFVNANGTSTSTAVYNYLKKEA